MYLKLARAFGRSNNCRQVPTIIGETTKVCGDINSNGILHVDGYIEGDINCEELVIGVKGNILGTVKAQSMFCTALCRARRQPTACLSPRRRN